MGNEQSYNAERARHDRDYQLPTEILSFHKLMDDSIDQLIIEFNLEELTLDQLHSCFKEILSVISTSLYLGYMYFDDKPVSADICTLFRNEGIAIWKNNEGTTSLAKNNPFLVQFLISIGFYQVVDNV